METKFKIGDRVRLTRDNAVPEWPEIEAGAVELQKVHKTLEIGDRVVVVDGALKGERGSVLKECDVDGCIIVRMDGLGFDAHLEKSMIRLDAKMAEAFANAERIESPTEDAKLDQDKPAPAEEPNTLLTVKVTKYGIGIRIEAESEIHDAGDMARVVILLERLRDELAEEV